MGRRWAALTTAKRPDALEWDEDGNVPDAVDSAVTGLDAPVVLAFHKAVASETPVAIALR